MHIEIFPMDRIVIDGTAIRFGMEQSAVEAAIGSGQRIGARQYYFNCEMAIDYRDGKVDFIEFSAGLDGALRPVIYGASAFDTEADALLEILMQKNDGPIGDTERGHSYQLHNISIGLYREAIPEDIREMVKEAADFGNPMSDGEIRDEMRKAEHWASLGVGAPGYYRR